MAEDPHHIVGWQRIDGRTTTSGRLTAGDVDALARLGVRHVINLALAESPGALPNEDALLADAGIRYTHIPVPFAAPSCDHYAAFRAAFAADAEPVHVHCIMNYRVSAFLYRYHRERGMAAVEARALMEPQWSPDTDPQPDAPTWARFIHKEGH